jgi:hypothetical protein
MCEIGERWKKRLFSFIRIKSDILMKGERTHESHSERNRADESFQGDSSEEFPQKFRAKRAIAGQYLDHERKNSRKGLSFGRTDRP